MNTVAKLTQKQIEKLAVEIRTFLLEHDMWVDTQIYFNGKCFDTHDKETGEFYYNDPEHLVVRENEDPRRYFLFTRTAKLTESLIACQCRSHGQELPMMRRRELVFQRERDGIL